MTYRDDLEALEAQAEDLRRQLSAAEERLVHVEAVRRATRATMPRGPSAGLSCMVVLAGVVFAFFAMAARQFSHPG